MMFDLPSLRLGMPMKTMPSNPRPSAYRWKRPGIRRSDRVATAAANSGMPPFNMPAKLDDTCCCASGNNVMGNASHVIETTKIPGQADRSTLARAFGTKASVTAPIMIRPKVTTPGAKVSSPVAMKRNDVPQIRPGITSSNQSRRVKASRWVPSADRLPRRDERTGVALGGIRRVCQSAWETPKSFCAVSQCGTVSTIFPT